MAAVRPAADGQVRRMIHACIERHIGCRGRGVRRSLGCVLVAALTIAAPAGAFAEDDDTELAKKLSNPLAAMISVPIQWNYNEGIGPLRDGSQSYFNVQPVIPFTLSDDWNLISRTIVPIIYQDEIFAGAGSQFGLGNTTQSLFFSPSQPVNGIVWGVGPVFYLPTNTDDLLGPDKWGAGPTAVALWQGDGWTVGALANHIWSFAGDEDAADINATYVQPFLSYTTPDAWTLTLNTEAAYDWENAEWSVPINFQISKLVKFGRLPVSLTAGVRYWADSPQGSGPDGWGGRFGVTFLLPK